MKITKFKKTTKGKYKVYLDNGEALSLYEDVIINNNLILTKQIDDDLIDDIIKQNNDMHVYGMSLNYISVRIRSKKEIEDYLTRKGISNDLITVTVNKLIKDGYINDFSFAKSYVNDELALSTYGPLKIKNNLVKYGISNDIISEVIEEIDLEMVREKLDNLIEKQIKIRKGSSNMLKLKLLNYFYNLGYEKQMILDLLNNYKMKTDITHLQKEYDKLYNKYSKKYANPELNLLIIQKLYAKGYTKEDIDKIKNED